MRQYALEIDRYLDQAIRQWQMAINLDYYKRLHDELSWLYLHIHSYKKAWDKRKRDSITGEILDLENAMES